MNKSFLIETKRLILRDMEASDEPAIHVFASDPEVSLHSTWGPNSLEDTQTWLRGAIVESKTMPRVGFELAVVKRETADVIGTARISRMLTESNLGEIGYTLRKNQWGHGFATEVAKALLDFGFRKLSLHRITATTSPLNIASQKVLEKAGMIREGCMRKHVMQRGVWRDSFLYGILEEEWLKG